MKKINRDRCVLAFTPKLKYKKETVSGPKTIKRKCCFIQQVLDFLLQHAIDPKSLHTFKSNLKDSRNKFHQGFFNANT